MLHLRTHGLQHASQFASQHHQKEQEEVAPRLLLGVPSDVEHPVQCMREAWFWKLVVTTTVGCFSDSKIQSQANVRCFPRTTSASVDLFLCVSFRGEVCCPRIETFRLQDLLWSAPRLLQTLDGASVCSQDPSLGVGVRC